MKKCRYNSIIPVFPNDDEMCMESQSFVSSTATSSGSSTKESSVHKAKKLRLTQATFSTNYRMPDSKWIVELHENFAQFFATSGIPLHIIEQPGFL